MTSADLIGPDNSLGVIYVAIRARFVAEARLSARSLRRFLPNIRIVLYTDQALEADDIFNDVVRFTPPHPLYHINKLIAMTQSPFEKTLLLDTDTYICAEISDLFAILDRFDIAMTQDRGFIDDFPPGTSVPDLFVEFNQGVIAFRKSEALQRSLQEAMIWVERLKAKWDQPPFRIALFHSDLRIATLPQEYNCRFASYGCLNGTVRVLHGRLPGPPMRMADFERVARMLNRVTVPRVFLKGALFAMVHTTRLGHDYWTRTLVGHFFRPSVALLRELAANLLQKFKRR